VVGIANPLEGLAEVLGLHVRNQGQPDLDQALERGHRDVSVPVKLEADLLGLLVYLEERLVLILLQLKSRAGILDAPTPVGNGLLNRRHPAATSDPRERAHRLGPVAEMVLDAFAEKMIAGIAFIVAEQPRVAECSRKGVSLILEGDCGFVLAAEAARPGTLAAAQRQLDAGFKKDRFGASIEPVVEVCGGDGRGWQIGHLQIAPHHARRSIRSIRTR